MKTITISEFKDALTQAAKIKGEKGVLHQKKLILEGDYMITDSNGMAVDPETLDVHILPAGAEAPMTESAKNQETSVLEEQITKSVRSAMSGAVKDAPKFAVTAEPKAWESARVYGRLKHFKDKSSAFRFGSWCLGAMGHKKSAQFCNDNGIILRKAHSEGVNVQGGFLVPDEFESELVTLREQYGVFRRNARVWPMASDTLRIPKRAAGLTAYFVGEMVAGTESTQTLDQVNLVAKKLMALTTVSNELLEDAVVNIGDDIAGEIAYAFSYKEDDAGFNGDGTSSYGQIVGLKNVLTDATYQISDGAATATSGVTLAEISAGLGKLPGWAAQRGNIKIFCNKSVYHAVFERLMYATGSGAATGAVATEIARGIATPSFLGYPVEFTQVLSANPSGAGAVFAYIGDMQQGCYLGDRRSTQIAFSDSALNAFEQDERVIRGSQRFDIVCANCGSSSASGAMIKMTL
jgi:HK97 family phage major capsid protein